MSKQQLDGKTFLPLSVQKQIIELRTAIEKNEQHAGQKFELVKKAYDEIRVAHGEAPSKYTASCSGCIQTMNNTLKNWFKLYDQLGVSEQRIAKAPEFKPLNPVPSTTGPASASNEEKKKPTYKELLEKFNEVATPEEKEALLKGRKTPKKDELIEYFNAKQN